MSRNKELTTLLDGFTESIKRLLESKEECAHIIEEYDYIDGTLLYEKETKAGTFMIAKYIEGPSGKEEDM